MRKPQEINVIVHYPATLCGMVSFVKQVVYANPNLLYDRIKKKRMKKKDLYIAAEVSPATITKMGRGGHVSTSVIMRICMALNCQPEDIMEITEM